METAVALRMSGEIEALLRNEAELTELIELTELRGTPSFGTMFNSDEATLSPSFVTMLLFCV